MSYGAFNNSKDMALDLSQRILFRVMSLTTLHTVPKKQPQRSNHRYKQSEQFLIPSATQSVTEVL
jgi:type II secretory ATPase GspE/PulE/Tfp pilus assembly ATPase PilB-like protein